MATGDTLDFQRRIIALLPRWFGDITGNAFALGLVAGAAYVFAQCYALLAYVRLQARITTATDGWLDLASVDFFDDDLPRNTGESDAAFRNRILANLFPERATRNGMVKALTMLTGRAPVIVEPWRPADVACVGMAALGVSPLGSYQMPAQAFISVTVPPGSGGGGIAGIGSNYAGLGTPAMAVASASSLESEISDQNIYDTVNAFKAEGTIMWVKVTS